MANLDLTPEELKVLEETLERSVNELTVEVAHTDSHEFKKALKEKKIVLDHLLEKVRGAPVAA